LVRREIAAESVAQNFTRVMRASTSRFGALTDPPIVCVLVAAVVVPAIVLGNLALLPDGALWVVVGLAALPVLAGFGVHVALRGVRSEIIDWLAALPFPLENMNALLNGIGHNLVVRFEGPPPSREHINALLDAVHPDSCCLEVHETEPEVELRIGVVDDKLNPLGANHRRYRRVRALVEQALTPLDQEHPIAWVRVA
jgi:hypothetical protein